MFSLSEGSKGVKLMSGFKENKLSLRELLEPGPDFKLLGISLIKSTLDGTTKDIGGFD